MVFLNKLQNYFLIKLFKNLEKNEASFSLINVFFFSNSFFFLRNKFLKKIWKNEYTLKIKKN